MSNTGETNVQVVVRVRPRNSKEIKENSQSIITTPNSKELSIRTLNECTKTYTFDKVIGADASQEQVYDQVMSGMLSEVLEGYNVTVFAYGQTGTGKTFTMLGDEPSSSNAGIIPRSLISLFESLEKDIAEYSVRVSFIELYNEELKDLLSPPDDFKKLRVFEDLARKGAVVIHGLEEITVKNTHDVLSILEKGSKKKQMAATKLNELSSRSHCIFSVTIHIKETTPEGEELLKVGKLNLVDLAGSENIGRSGAENKRAKEAGMINQSLLTLGRVINALVERSPHIPYRESKLTRLLQDSLGGRTKTCIIAAVSPAKCNLEETLSTLEYAHRAKNIRNKPEVNQRMTKRALIKEYVTEIERLKADLLATRDKNGIYMSPENYDSLVQENQGRQARIEEITTFIAFKEDQINSLNKKFAETTKRLNMTEVRLDETIQELDTRSNELSKALIDLTNLEQSLEQRKMLVRAYQKTEKKLDQIAGGLVSTIGNTVNDLEIVHVALDRKRTLEARNLMSFSSMQEILYHHINDIERRIESANQLIRDSFRSLLDRMSQSVTQNSNIFNIFKGDLFGQLNDITDLILASQTFVSTSSGRDSLALNTIAEDLTKVIINLNAAHQLLLDEDQKTAENIKSTISQIETEQLKANQHINGILSDSSKNLMDFLEKSKKDTKESYSSREKRLLDQNLNLKKHVEFLNETIDAMRSTMLKEKENFLNFIHQKSGEIFDKNIDRLNQLASETRVMCGTEIQDNLASHELNKNHQARHELELDGFISCREEEYCKTTNLLEENLQMNLSSLNKFCSDLKASRNGSGSLADKVRSEVETQISLSVKTLSKTMDNTAESKNYMSDNLNNVQILVNNSLEYIKTGTHKSINSLQESNSNIQDMTNFIEKKEEELYNNYRTELSNLFKEIQIRNLEEDQSTGMTPKRRVFEYPSSWTLTNIYDNSIAEFEEDQTISEADSPISMDKDQENLENHSKLPKMRTRRDYAMMKSINL